MGSPGDEAMRQEEEKAHSVSDNPRFRHLLYRSYPKAVGGRHGEQPECRSWRNPAGRQRLLDPGDSSSAGSCPSVKDEPTVCRPRRSGSWPVEPDRPRRLPPLSSPSWRGTRITATAPVSLSRPSRRTPGVCYDMLGNVAEWCLDYYAAYDQAAVEDPRGPSTGRARVVRGGSWKNFRPALRPAARSSAPEAYQLGYIGFRVVLE